VRLALLANAQVIHTRRWADYFHARGHAVELISLEPDPGFAYPCHVLASRVPWRFLRYPLAAPRVRRLLARFDPDVVNAHFVPNYGLIGVLAGRRPLVVSAWGSDVLVSGVASPLHAARVRYVLARADRITTDAAMLTRAVIALGGPPERVVTVPMGVEPERYRAARAVEPGTEAPGSPLLVVSTRKLEPIYNVAQLIDAVPPLLAARPEALIEVAGDGPERPALAARADGAAPGRVLFRGMLPHAEMARLLGRAAVYVSTSRSDSTSVSLLEAMAAGAFPVVTDIEANREWIEDGVNGFLTPLDDPGALAARIARALTAPELRRRAAAENARRIDERATWSRNMAVVESMFEDLIAARGARR
jgi:glycosyltransferase involved in cell wall biosynthesis